MILWLIYFFLALIISILCYATNWLVVLFANDDGELPSFLHLWQTWDNSIDCSDSVSVAPKFLQYDWKAHYREYVGTTTYLRSVNRDRWYSLCYNDKFTIIELLQRYCCRVLWLMRNNAYGFCFYLLGQNVSPQSEITTSEHTEFVREIYGGNVGGAWKYKNTAPIFHLFGYTVHFNNLLGWKIDESAQVVTRAMLACRPLAFYFERAEE